MFTLCYGLGFPHPDYLLPYLSARQLYEWQMWMQKYNPRIDRDDQLWGMQLSMYYNAHRGEQDTAMRPEDFMPYFDRFEEDITLEELKERCSIRSLLK